LIVGRYYLVHGGYLSTGVLSGRAVSRYNKRHNKRDNTSWPASQRSFIAIYAGAGMSDEFSFGRWLQRRRKALDLTQAELARRVGCAPDTLRKIEADVRRPSRQLAEQLANGLALRPSEQAAFMKAAREEQTVDALPPPSQSAPHIISVAPAGLPTGTVTFLFTDIEGSTQLWEQHPETMQAALARHDTILRDTVETHGGVVVKTTGDGLCAAFTRAPDGLAACLAAQRALQLDVWGVNGPLRVRMALHTGVAEIRAGDYYGTPLNRVARLMAAGHGGQILLTQATQALLRDDLPLDVELRDLGTHRLKDLTRPEQIFQVVASDLPIEFPPLTTLDIRPNNLPVQPTPLIGRDTAVARLCEVLRRPDARLVTLTGPGGIGKTRLAFQVAADLLHDFVDGVWFVDLAPISDPELVVPTIAHTLGVRETGTQPLVEQLHTYLHPKRLLVLLDNFEQIVDAAPQVAELLAAAPQVKIVVTSRTVLRLRGEQEYAVLPLALPDLKQLPPLATVSQYAAVALFIQRAQDVELDFQVTNANAPAVAEICARLDGLPLAIELAAVRVKLFPPQALLARLGSRLKLLTGGARDLPERQQTIRATIDWSYHLLDADEQTLFARLGVFVGGCTLEAVEAVCNAARDLPMDVIDGVAVLLDQSLLRQVEGSDGEPRFTMLETIREYALERLAAHGEAEALRERHLAYYLALAEAAEPHLRGAEQIIWADRLEVEHDNLRAALAWAHDHGADDSSTTAGVEAELRLAGALFWFWDIRNYQIEGLRWLEGALARTGAPARTAARAMALFAAGRLTAHWGDYVAGGARLEESVALWRELGDKRGLALALTYANGLGWVALYERRVAEARALFAEGVALWRELGDKWGLAKALWSLGAAVRRDDPAAARPILEESVALFRDVGDAWGLMDTRDQLGIVARAEGDYMQAGLLFEESLAISRETGNKGSLATSLKGLADVVQDQGDYRRALALYQESLALARRFEWKEGIAHCLVGVGGVASAVGQAERAARLLSAAETLLDSIGLSLAAWPEVRADFDHYVAVARAQLDEASFAAAWAAGRQLTLAQAVAYALGEEIELLGY